MMTIAATAARTTAAGGRRRLRPAARELRAGTRRRLSRRVATIIYSQYLYFFMYLHFSLQYVVAYCYDGFFLCEVNEGTGSKQIL
jgi:hypothetical protein